MVTATDFGIYFLTLPVLRFGTAKALSFTCAGVLGYLLNSYWIFARTRPSFAEVGRYTLTNVLALILNVSVNASAITVFHASVYAAFAAAVSITAVFTYLCFSWWVFRKI